MNTPADFILNKVKSVISFVEEEPDYSQFYIDLNFFDLVVIEHKGIKLIGKPQDYYLSEDTKVNACYFTDNFSTKPIILNKENVKGKLGDIRLFVSKYEQELLTIAREIKVSSILALINIFISAKKSNTPLEKPYLKDLKRQYNYKLNVVHYSL